MSAIVLDTETTGLLPREDRVIEIAIVRFDDGEPLFHTLIHPDRPIPPETTEIHGITDEMVADSPKFEEVADEIARHIRDAEAVIGQNIFFDRGMLAGEFARLSGFNAPRWPTLVCTKRIWDLHEPKRSLTAAFKRFVDRSGFKAHRALDDVLACRQVLLNQMQEFGLERDWSKIDPEQRMWWGPSGHFIWKEGTLVCTFGKNKGLPAFRIETSFWTWLIKQDFPEHVKVLGDFMIHVYRDPEHLHSWARVKEVSL